jgi:PDZ domain
VIRPPLQTRLFDRLSHRLGHPPARSFHETKYRLSKIAIVLTREIRRAAKAQLLNQYQTSATPCVAWDFAEPAGAAKEVEHYSCRPVAGRKTVWTIPLPAEFLKDLDKMLVCATELVPAPRNAAESQGDSSIGAGLLKALGMEATVPKGPIGLRIQSVGAGLPAARAGLKTGDVLRSVEGWKVINDRELGWVLRESAGRKSLRFRVDRLHEKSSIVQIPLPSSVLTPPTGPNPINTGMRPGRPHGFAVLDRRAGRIAAASAGGTLRR